MIDETWAEFHATGLRSAMLRVDRAASKFSSALSSFGAAVRDYEAQEFVRLTHVFRNGPGPRSVARTARRHGQAASRRARKARRAQLRRMLRTVHQNTAPEETPCP